MRCGMNCLKGVGFVSFSVIEIAGHTLLISPNPITNAYLNYSSTGQGFGYKNYYQSLGDKILK